MFLANIHGPLDGGMVNGYTITVPLEAVTQRNFAADFIWLKLNFIKKHKNCFSGCLRDQQVWFPVDFQETFSRTFSTICSFIDIYRVGSLTLGITLILFTQAIAQLKDIYRGLIAPTAINPGLLQDVLLVHCEVQEFWVSQKISRRLC